MTGPTDHPETPDDRRAQLVVAAAGDDLSASEEREYAALVAADPTVADEVAELRSLLGEVASLGTGWRDEHPPADLEDRILAATSDEATPTPARRSRGGLVAAAVALLVLGAGLGVGVDTWRDRPPGGPAGTLGAVEEITFDSTARGTTIDAALVAHTWGTETVLEMDGFAIGERFEVVLVGEDGTPARSGSFLGSRATVLCRLNAALLREDVGAVEILDADGDVVARSTVPDVDA